MQVRVCLRLHLHIPKVDMNKKDPKYESLKSKLIKLSRLADSGDTHEARNARLAVERICQQYGVSIDEILSDEQESKWYEFDIGRSSKMLALFAQCHGVVTGKRRLTYRRIPRSSKLDVCLTAFEYAELKSMFAWHQANYKAEREKTEETLFQAYIHKHNLFRAESESDEDTEEEEEEEKELTPEMLDRIKRILLMKQTLSDTHYHKMIEQ